MLDRKEGTLIGKGDIKMVDNNREIIIEFLEKTDPALIDRFKQITNEIKELQKELENLTTKFDVAKNGLEEQTNILEKERNGLIGRVFFNK